LAAGDVVVDLYAGVGLLGGSLVAASSAGGEVGLILVERGRSSVADARHNLADLRPRVRAMAVEKWRPEPATVVVADPSRSGLGREAADRVAATGARRVVLVSCDAASLGRDTRLLVERGYAHRGSVLVDQFALTSQVEVVTRFDLG
jgi:tRNA/tmRNA/rRNA uracil-C5-methylase (TrmA/RlmC/RlmD family)